jgi:hypothetical protein
MEWILLGILAGALWLTIWGIRSLLKSTSAGPRRQGAGASDVTAGVVGGAAGAAVAGGTGIAAPSAINTSPIGAASDEIDGMNEGDYRSGPAGYSPMTAYPETQYGSGFDEDAAWHEEQ